MAALSLLPLVNSRNKSRRRRIRRNTRSRKTKIRRIARTDIRTTKAIQQEEKRNQKQHIINMLKDMIKTNHNKKQIRGWGREEKNKKKNNSDDNSGKKIKIMQKMTKMMQKKMIKRGK